MVSLDKADMMIYLISFFCGTTCYWGNHKGLCCLQCHRAPFMFLWYHMIILLMLLLTTRFKLKPESLNNHCCESTIKLHSNLSCWSSEKEREPVGFEFLDQCKCCGKRGMEIRLGIWTLQWSCHAANGGSGAEGQESSAPVWKINDHGATGGNDRQSKKNSETDLSYLTTLKIKVTWPLLRDFNINYTMDKHLKMIKTQFFLSHSPQKTWD